MLRYIIYTSENIFEDELILYGLVIKYEYGYLKGNELISQLKYQTFFVALKKFINLLDHPTCSENLWIKTKKSR